ncbi:Fe-S cluster assembly transcriptional regulator IscR [Cupriavidus cauae]|uniref:Fe-S cluster assembly transcriptional regulator IscR n=1 Tax=Cupriavidus cauae TaxID=2608999 RepID=A0A5M8BF27_9BURK|nr:MULTISPECIES: Fe-S cluster assembly transcriptional regulator IscR [Cupriavidus]KAA6133235.1 Fe-S cluster assembly transcriptional regulator IscR [Cupriavidus cauae]MCA7086208.1 Fe-S cluster assembly transcriptional regulator IscR [Cupriavidus sp. DB3]UZN48006.1 Fe-S cluster assembly transcriptional regulator IscR [Cupriavidus cauae]
MRLTTKGRFAVTAMIDLAMRQDQGPVTLAGISQRQKISLSYLEQLFAKLRRHQIVESVRGPGGGYSLARKSEDVTVADIIIAVDEPLDATQCGGKGNCNGDENTGRCMTHELWATLNQKMVEYLDSVSLKDLVEQQRARQPGVLRDMREEGGVRQSAPAARTAQPGAAEKADKPARPKMVNSVFSLAQS